MRSTGSIQETEDQKVSINDRINPYYEANQRSLPSSVRLGLRQRPQVEIETNVEAVEGGGYDIQGVPEGLD